ncbi:HNH endonuclease [Bacillus sp. FJAT-26390]|uniref:HNH endonuclease n=1 Tax=Bacillus sp. FJAT-26390 TaxID=1743142 RepID=UPI000807C615|nr:HNH endonuclease [Bacillus sp. FJAT-26390]OBZ17115.1 hypothetical protein A7975_04295 [Bacillus sp. FJAT-26390]
MQRHITFISRNEKFIEEFSNFNDFDTFFLALVAPFLVSDEHGTLICEQPFIMSKENKEKIKNIIIPYTQLNRSFNKIMHFFIKINDGECFYFFPDKLTQELCIDCQKSLEYYNQRFDHEWVQKMMQSYLDNNSKLSQIHEQLSKDFSVSFFSYNKKEYLGERNKNKRVCRFCNRDMNKGASFKNEAHTIPAFLGNTTLFQNEECDECNSYFGSTIENDLEKYTKLLRIFAGTKGRNGVPELRNGDTIFFYSEVEDGIGIPVIVSDKNMAATELAIQISNEEMFTPENVYKMFCKIFFSVVNSELLNKFDDTLKWVRNNIPLIENLPVVAFSFFQERKHEQPYAATFIKKEADDKTPNAFIEIGFGQFVYITQIPSRENESELLYTAEQFNKFLRSLPHYKNAYFNYYDFSGKTPEHFHLNFFQHVD